MKYFSLIFALAFASVAYAQEAVIPNPSKPISVQILAGTQGIGAEVRYGVLPKLGVRLGGSTSTAIKVNDAIKYDGFESNNVINAEISNVHLLADYAPFNTNAFRIVAGAGYLFQAGGGLEFSPIAGKNYTFGEVTLTSEEVGQLAVDMSWKGLAPYLGLGLFKALPKRRFNVNLDLGSYFLKPPKSTVVGTKTLSDNDAMGAQLEKNMEGYRFLPVLQLNFNFRIN